MSEWRAAPSGPRWTRCEIVAVRQGPGGAGRAGLAFWLERPDQSCDRAFGEGFELSRDEIERPTVIAVVGQQRSGTTGFRQFIGSFPGCIDLGEILSGHVDLDTSFWRFIRTRSVEHPEWVCPHFWHFAWEEYIFTQSRLYESAVLVFDMKIDVIPNVYLHRSFSKPHESQFIFSWDKLKVIHLERVNILAQIVSRKSAEQSGEWTQISNKASRDQISRFFKTRENLGDVPASFRSILSGEAGQNAAAEALDLYPDLGSIDERHERRKVFLDPHRVEAEIELILEANNFATQAIQPLSPLKVLYERFYTEEGKLRFDVAGDVLRYLGLDLSCIPQELLTKKQASVDFLDVVINKSEIIEHFKRSNYAWMLPRTE